MAVQFEFMDVKKNIFILTGAGISKESGIQTFREKDGLWDNHRIEDVCTVEAFLRNPNMLGNSSNSSNLCVAKPKCPFTTGCKPVKKHAREGLQTEKGVKANWKRAPSSASLSSIGVLT